VCVGLWRVCVHEQILQLYADERRKKKDVLACHMM
jgi:hypothetical protein